MKFKPQQCYKLVKTLLQTENEGKLGFELWPRFADFARFFCAFALNVYKDLGLFPASDISWNQHVDKITAKANRVLGLVKRTCRDLKDIDTMNTLYCSLVRPLLEYSCETWNPHTKRNIDKLEAVQRRAARWITRSYDDYDTRLSKLKLLSLSNRRFNSNVTFF